MSFEREAYQAGDKTVILVKEPRFGHWTIQLEHGQIPDQLKSSFLSKGDARAAAKRYYEDEKSRWARRESPAAKAPFNEVRKELGLKEV